MIGKENGGRVMSEIVYATLGIVAGVGFIAFGILIIVCISTM